MQKSTLYPLLTLLAFGYFGSTLTTQADTPSPPPNGQPFQNEGDRGNGNTSEGKDALSGLTTGTNNTAMGFDTLFSNTVANEGTAVGYQALYNNVGSTTPDPTTGFLGRLAKYGGRLARAV